MPLPRPASSTPRRARPSARTLRAHSFSNSRSGDSPASGQARVELVARPFEVEREERPLRRPASAAPPPSPRWRRGRRRRPGGTCGAWPSTGRSGRGGRARGARRRTPGSGRPPPRGPCPPPPDVPVDRPPVGRDEGLERAGPLPGVPLRAASTTEARVGGKKPPLIPSDGASSGPAPARSGRGRAPPRPARGGAPSRGRRPRARGASPRRPRRARRCSAASRARSAFQAASSGSPSGRRNQLLPSRANDPLFSPVSFRLTAYFQYAA